jgi:hypothetical protein
MADDHDSVDVVARAICEALGDDWHREGDERLTGYDEPAERVLGALHAAGCSPVPREAEISRLRALLYDLVGDPEHDLETVASNVTPDWVDSARAELGVAKDPIAAYSRKPVKE